MGETWGPLLVAVVGVLGTLGAALVTQVRADRIKLVELDTMRRQQLEDRAHAERTRTVERAEARELENLERRRACYISFNTAARQYQTAQVGLVHAMKSRTDVDGCLERLEACRTAFRACYAEAQMLVPAAVLETAAVVSRRLNGGYGLLKQLLAASAPDDRTARDCEERVRTAWGLLSALREEMRRDLGIGGSTP
ncbi:hypothetical protein [Streptomyces sp. NPDC058964]|uniref:hypothetical protein n=1 Tax=Streptomyces sp. NPDC058964 TaxID=3346681 RepID=UPI0036B7D3CD